MMSRFLDMLARAILVLVVGGGALLILAAVAVMLREDLRGTLVVLLAGVGFNAVLGWAANRVSKARRT